MIYFEHAFKFKYAFPSKTMFDDDIVRADRYKETFQTEIINLNLNFKSSNKFPNKWPT